MTEKDEKASAGTRNVNLPRYLGLASAGAAILLVLAVLPAEYGIDPTGFGRLTGLVQLAPHHDEGHHSPDEGAAAGVFPGTYSTETIRIDIEPLGEVEHKMYMPQGGGFVYSWIVEGDTPNGGVYFDFHGHPASEDAESYQPGFEQVYGEGEEASQNGVFHAPFPGYHGWYFLNLEDRAITVTIAVSGFYDSHLELYRAVEGNVITAIEY